MKTVCLFLSLLLCTCAIGCKLKPQWQAQAKSPDGVYVATGRTEISGGFGTGGGGTIVELNWSSGNQRGLPVFITPDGPYSPGDPSVIQLNWLSPSHLEVVYSGRDEPVFEAIRYQTVDVTVKRVASPPDKLTPLQPGTVQDCGPDGFVSGSKDVCKDGGYIKK
jgi:hypothetical protein